MINDGYDSHSIDIFIGKTYNEKKPIEVRMYVYIGMVNTIYHTARD